MKDEYLIGSPPGFVCFGSETGWMTAKIFVEVLEHIKKHKDCSIDNPIILIVDNHKTTLVSTSLYSRDSTLGCRNIWAF